MVRGMFYGFFVGLLMSAVASQISGVLAFITLIVITAAGTMIGARTKKFELADTVNMERLTTQEKVLTWVFNFLVSPIIVGAVLYFMWHKTHPAKAKQANRISFIAMFILLAIGFTFQFYAKPLLVEKALENRGFSVQQSDNLENSFTDQEDKYEITFPQDWTQINGGGYDVAAYDTRNEDTIIGVQIMDLPVNFTTTEGEFVNSLKNDPKRYENSLRSTFPDAQFIESYVVKVDGRDAYYVKLNATTEKGMKATISNYIFDYNLKIFQIISVSSEKNFPLVENSIKDTVQSVKFLK